MHPFDYYQQLKLLEDERKRERERLKGYETDKINAQNSYKYWIVQQPRSCPGELAHGHWTGKDWLNRRLIDWGKVKACSDAINRNINNTNIAASNISKALNNINNSNILINQWSSNITFWNVLFQNSSKK